MSRQAGDRWRTAWDLDDSVGSTGRAVCAIAAVLVSLLVSTITDSLGMKALVGLVTILVVYPAFLALARLAKRRFG